MTNTKTQSKINTNQQHILSLLYKFRFLTIKQLQTYFKHKDSHRIKEWLTDLKEKKYISVIMDKTNPTKPYVFCLATKARYILRDDENYDKSFLERLHKEKGLKELFRNHLLFIFDTYLYFISRQEKDTTLHFLTKQDLSGYDFFPEELPDVYIAVESKNGIDKYFLELFDEYRDKPGLVRYAIRKYLDYSENGDWQANTNDSSFPSLLFIMTNERRKAFVSHYGKSKLAKTFVDISLSVTTQGAVKLNKDNIWTELN